MAIKFSHFAASNSIFPGCSKQESSAGVSWFLCGQIEMSELALEQNHWQGPKQSPKANELSRCCHTRWQTDGPRRSGGFQPASHLHSSQLNPRFQHLSEPDISQPELCCSLFALQIFTQYLTIDYFSPDHFCVAHFVEFEMTFNLLKCRLNVNPHISPV